jgi:hypothetical protein
MAFRIRWNSVRFIAWLEGAQAHDRERAVVFSRSGQTSALFSQFLPRKKLPFYRRWSFMAVPMATISLRVDFFASSERGKKRTIRIVPAKVLSVFMGMFN